MPNEIHGVSHGVASYQELAQPENVLESVLSISQIMTTPVFTIYAVFPVDSAWQKLAEHSVRQLVVISPLNEVQGFLSERGCFENARYPYNQDKSRKSTGVAYYAAGCHCLK